jgi:hypothetical protein
MRLGVSRAVRLAARELEGREGSHELRMDVADVGLDLREQRLLVLSLQDLSAPALDDGCHPAVKTS